MSPRLAPGLATAHEWGLPSSGPRSLRRGGWGDANEAARGVQVGSSVAAPVITGIIASHAAATAAATGVGASILGMAPALAVPLIGAAMLGATILITTLIRNSGCGQTCVVTSQWANQAATALQQNLDAYRNGPRTKASQGVALANFDAIWEALKQQCGQPGTGDAGKRCISDRQRGACTWKDNGECWDWFKGYRDPIANDSAVANPPLDSIDAALSDTGSSVLPLLAIAGLITAAVVL